MFCNTHICIIITIYTLVDKSFYIQFQYQIDIPNLKNVLVRKRLTSNEEVIAEIIYVII